MFLKKSKPISKSKSLCRTLSRSKINVSVMSKLLVVISQVILKLIYELMNLREN
jgi:hypothetical protein